MPRKKPDPVEDDEEDDDEAAIDRDFVMARLAAARTSLQASIDAVDECLSLFVNPDEDEKAKERCELLDTAVEAVGVASRCLESAEEVIEDIDPELGEPWDEEEAELPRARVVRGARG